MTGVAEFQSFKLKKGVAASEFLLASDKFNNEFLSKQKGYISYKVLKKGDTWYDFLVWESEENVSAAAEAYKSYAEKTSNHYISFIDEESQSELLQLQIEKDYK